MAMVGGDSYAYYNSGSNAVPVWVLMGEIGDLRIPTLEVSVAEIKTRSSKGTKSLPANFSAKLEFDYLYEAQETVFEYLRAWFFARTIKQVAIMDGVIATSGSEGLKIPVVLESFPINQENEGIVKVDVRMSPGYMVESSAVIEPVWLVV